MRLRRFLPALAVALAASAALGPPATAAPGEGGGAVAAPPASGVDTGADTGGATSGPPVVAPYRGVVAVVGYQARGAGHYVVIEGEDYDYVFMHLRGGSIVVRQGDQVRSGATIGEVGSSGESSGP